MKYLIVILLLTQSAFLIAQRNSSEKFRDQLEALNKKVIEAALEKDFNLINHLYLDSAILLAEYQPLLDGKPKIAEFYQETYKRQDLKSCSRDTREVLVLGNHILETGVFQKVFNNGTKLDGKYMTNWLITENKLKISSECFGFFGEPENKQDFRIMNLTDDSTPLQLRNGKEMPFELKLYSAYGENLVRDRDTEGVIDRYSNDGIYFPFADTAKTGNDELTKHFTAYHKTPVKIDSIEVWTYHYELVPDGMIRIGRFYVIWTLNNGYTGTSTGAGLSYWKRNEKNELKIHRQIGTHIYLPE